MVTTPYDFQTGPPCIRDVYIGTNLWLRASSKHWYRYQISNQHPKCSSLLWRHNDTRPHKTIETFWFPVQAKLYFDWKIVPETNFDLLQYASDKFYILPVLKYKVWTEYLLKFCKIKIWYYLWSLFVFYLLYRLGHSWLRGPSKS